MANEIGNGNKFSTNFLQLNYLDGGVGQENANHAGDILDLLRQVDKDPVWDATAPADAESLKRAAKLEKSLSVGSTRETTDTSGAIADTLSAVSNLLDSVNKLAFSTSEPNPSDSGHPEGSLKVGSDGVITTPGGFKIEATGQFDWKITGPDGKETKIWGDPHVKESDGGAWDFKRDSTFVLADGTRINAKTTPWQNGQMTVTKGLEIISGNDRVEVSDIDKGKGKVGQITKDGYASVNNFGNKDVFVMGKETDDWSFKGKEIIGSNNGGESFKVGKDLEAGVVGPLVEKNKENGGAEFFTQMYKQISAMYDQLMGAMGTDGKAPDLGKLELPGMTPESESAFSKENPGALDRLSKSFKAIAALFDALAKILDLARSIPQRRTYQQA